MPLLCTELLKYQTYVGEVPALIPVAVNVIPAPAHTLVEEEEMETEGVLTGFTVIFKPLEVAVFEVKQVGKFPPEVTIAFTASLLEGT